MNESLFCQNDRIYKAFMSGTVLEKLKIQLDLKCMLYYVAKQLSFLNVSLISVCGFTLQSIKFVD